jgi:hypothetical protein
MKNAWKYLIPAILGMIIGALLYHVLIKPDPPLPIIQPPEAPALKPKPQPPDTVRIIAYLPAPPAKTDTVYLPDPATPDKVTSVTYLEDDIETVPLKPYFESEISYFYGPNMVHNPKLKADSSWLAKTTTWAYSPAPVDSFKQIPVIRWNHYYNTYVEPRVTERIRQERIGNKFNGALGGMAMVGGIVGGEWWSVAGGLTLGYLFLFDVIEIPF